MSDTPALTGTRIIEDTADILGITPDTLDPHAPLVEQGLDSLRAVTLVETWRADGATVDFHEIMSLQTLDEWITALT
ncbi:phosphopantetheine-binding protein [Corynebacterium sp. CCM 9185]|uniref:Isochorismatase n=1 Tax=Corynebacterium marambiense TaxID=2765364 RepID=A0ABS0VV39_9CORY|nr:phosphopantetheine-binding protein [Corynebacterium marambiense]MBI8999480.1 isochorismatase [Corynebacterium marambiense]MCK7662318.1 phosphopantetheine-binding protein [Corynebacterium marambiense]